ncbi:MAG: amidohydrolase family protein [Promethearchaeota archaeon]
MIIDMHVHPFCKEATWGDFNKIADALWGLDLIKKKYMRPMLEHLATKTSIDEYIALMDKFSIDKAVIVSFNVTTAYGICLVTNDDVANLVERHPNRLIGFGCVDVPASDAMDQLDYAITSLGLKGIKLVPPVQKFDISDKKYDPLWKKMVDLDVPLWTHGGHQVSTSGSVAKYGNPMLIDEMAMRHEDLTIIIGHMGTPWFWDTYSVVLRHPRVYVDISAHPNLYSYFPWDAYTSYNIENKVLFASDHPLTHWSKYFPAIEALPISKGFKKRILGENATKLLGIKK